MNNVQIVVLNNRWIVIGDVTIENQIVTITNCHCIEYWGTSKGIGELCDGPKPTTRLRKQGITTVHILCVTQMIKCNTEKWNVLTN